MGIFDFWHQKEQQLDASRVSAALIRDTTDLVVKIAAPRAALLRNYRERLAPPVESAILHVRGLVAGLPPARDATAQGWATDPFVHACFAAPDDIPGLFGRFDELRAFFDAAPAAEFAFGLLGMRMTERKVLGMELQGDIVRSDVPQTTISFSEHALRILGPTEAELRLEIGRRALEQLGLLALHRIGAMRSARRDIEDQDALIKARLRLLQSPGAAFGGKPEPTPEGALANRARLEAQLEENERQLAKQVVDPLEHELDCLVEVLAHPGQAIAAATKTLWLTSMNVVAPAEAGAVGAVQASEVTVPLVEIAGEPPVVRALSLVRFPHSDYRPRRLAIGDVERYLG